jgi:hypothetical protein
MMLKDELEFEARYYLSESRRLSKEALTLMHKSDDLLELAVDTWYRAKEVPR